MPFCAETRCRFSSGTPNTPVADCDQGRTGPARARNFRPDPVVRDEGGSVAIGPDPSKGAATDYATLGVYILFQKPDDIRILGQDPVIGSTIFDMVSNGKEFRVSIRRKKRFIIGNNNAPGTAENKLENLRPIALLTSLMFYPPDPTDFTVLEDDTERALYILLIIRREQGPTCARSRYLFRPLQLASHTAKDVRCGRQHCE